VATRPGAKMPHAVLLVTNLSTAPSKRGIAMQRLLPLVIILLVAALVGGLWWFVQPGDVAPDTATPQPAAENHGAKAPVSATADVATAQANRAEAPTTTNAAEASASGSKNAVLRVHAFWPDEQPAADVLLTLRWNTREHAHAVHSQVQTDANGLAIFTSVQPGKWSLRSDRGDRESLDVEPGEHDIKFQLKGGVTVTGTVVNSQQQPIGDASVWLQTSRSDWSGGSVLAVTGADGQFTLHSIPPEVSLGAFARNYTRSPLVDLDLVDTKSSPTKVTLQLLDGGGQLTGTVVDIAGKPIANALIGAGRTSQRLVTQGNRVIETWSIRSTRSAADGRFVLEGLLPAETRVSVRAKGFGFWRSTCTIQDQQDTDLTITLERSGSVHGIITNDAGEPFVNALVRCYDIAPKVPFLALGQIDFDEPLGYLATVADENGHYRLDDVSAGTAYVFAQKGGRYLSMGEPVPHAKADLEVPPGGKVEWSPTISNGNSVEGIVYYKDGHPMPNVFVTLSNTKTGKQHVLTNNKEGVFHFVNLEDGVYDIQVQVWNAPKGAPSLEQAGIVPNKGRLELHATWNKPVKKASGTVTGRVDDLGLRIQNSNNAYVSLHSEERWFREGDKLVDGNFTFTKVTPCKFRLVLMEGNTVLAESDWHELLPGAQLDTGVLQTVPGGHLHVTAVRQPGTAACKPTLYLRSPDATRSTQSAFGTSNEVSVRSLTPGTYSATIYGKGMASVSTSVTITAGATSELSVTFHPGALTRFEAWLPVGCKATNYSYVIRDAAGQKVHDGGGEFGTRPRRPLAFAKTLPAGAYTIDFEAEGTGTGQKAFTVDGTNTETTVRIDVHAK